jgi:hypothetical protein
MVEAAAFRHLSNRYSVMGVPRTVTNVTAFIQGAAPEAVLIANLPIGK